MRFLILAFLIGLVGCGFSQKSEKLVDPAPIEMDYKFGLMRARQLEQQGQWNEALNIYNDIIQKTHAHQPKVAALALFASSFCYEALGLDDKALLALQDAERKKADLPIEVEQAELLARLAIVHYRLGNIEASKKYFKEADRGATLLGIQESDKTLSADLKGKMFTSMGSMVTYHDNVQQDLISLKQLQQFSLRAAELDTKNWSEQGSEQLKIQYRDIWNKIQAIKDVKEKAALLIDLLQNIDLLEIKYSPLARRSNVHLRSLKNFVLEMKKRARLDLHDLPADVSLTPESEKRNAIKRAQ